MNFMKFKFGIKIKLFESTLSCISCQGCFLDCNEEKRFCFTSGFKGNLVHCTVLGI